MNKTVNKGIYKKALALAVPMMIQNGITNAVGLVDNLMVGSLGTESMTAVSISGQLMFVFNLGVFGALTGPAIYGAQYFGQGNKEGFKNVLRLKYWICALFLIIGVLAFMFGGPFLIGLYLNGESNGIDAALTLKLGLEYLHIMIWGFVPFVITQIYAGSLRETGESIKPMVAGIVSVVVDIVFNYLLIYGKAGFPCLGVRGAAIATVLARIVETAIVVIWTHVKIKEHPYLQGMYDTIKIPIRSMKVMIVKSIPMFLNEFMWAGAMAALTQCYSVRGLEVVAGINISNAICNLLNVVFIAMGGAVGIITGQSLGASKFKEAKEEGLKLMNFTGAICIILTVLLIAASGAFPKFYNTTEEVRSLGRSFIIINALFFPIQGYLNALYFTLRSGGKTVITFLFDSIYTWCGPVVVAFILCGFTNLGVLWIFTIIQAMDIIKITIGYILIQKGIWITNLVADEA